MANRTTNERFSRRGQKKQVSNDGHTIDTSSIMSMSDFDASNLISDND